VRPRRSSCGLVARRRRLRNRASLLVTTSFGYRIRFFLLSLLSHHDTDRSLAFRLERWD
jgi:hypothetical protein